jgi:hypothetical protein
MSTTASERSALPPGIVLYQMAIGHYVSRALYLAAKLGIADLLKDGPRDHRELASASETHAPSLNRVLRLLASVGIFEELEGGRFALEPLGELLRADVSGSMRAAVMLFAGIGIQDSWKELESRGAAANDVNMLVCTGGRQRSEEEFRALFRASGFRLTRVVPTPARVCVIEGTRASQEVRP